MEQDTGQQIRFRELDQDGQPADRDSIDLLEPDNYRSRRFMVNPFIMVLWGLAAALVALGIWGLISAAAMLGPTSESTTLLFVVMNFSPWAILAGTLDATALLFWHALQWQRSRRYQEGR